MKPEAGEVQTLFNQKARCWPEKYQAGGKLGFRLEQFVMRLSELLPPPGNILDLGCGTGDISMAIGRRGYNVTACDIAETMLETARRNWTGEPVQWVSLKPDWDVLPFKNDTFDAVVAASVFEYLGDVAGVARELARVMRDDGVLIFSVPNPCNGVRKFEAWLAEGRLRFILKLLSGRVPRRRTYLTYLDLSQNRFGPDGWKSVLASAGFAPFDPQSFSYESWLDNAKAPLVTLVAKKGGRSGRHSAA